MKSTSLIDPLYQTLIGFENLFNRHQPAYPPYNIIRSPDSDHYTIEIAVSGFTRQELQVSLTGNRLEVRGTKETKPDGEYLVHQLAHRSWVRTWTLNHNIVVENVALKDGVLVITLAPEEAVKPNYIQIN